MKDMRLTDFEVLTFDCYGTLIDWESGIFTALQPLLAEVADDPGRDTVLETFARYESAQQSATPDKLYPELLAEVHAQLARSVVRPLGRERKRRARPPVRSFGRALARIRGFGASARLFKATLPAGDSVERRSKKLCHK